MHKVGRAYHNSITSLLLIKAIVGCFGPVSKASPYACLRRQREVLDAHAPAYTEFKAECEEAERSVESLF